MIELSRAKQVKEEAVRKEAAEEQIKKEARSRGGYLKEETDPDAPDEAEMQDFKSTSARCATGWQRQPVAQLAAAAAAANSGAANGHGGAPRSQQGCIDEGDADARTDAVKKLLTKVKRAKKKVQQAEAEEEEEEEGSTEVETRK